MLIFCAFFCYSNIHSQMCMENIAVFWFLTLTRPVSSAFDIFDMWTMDLVL
uniref:Uncharacterized protein n=1 Tax=Arundo donax TaxID=35708 RepID=A0A0A9AFX1_ARUDO